MTNTKNAVVTGASRGLGLALARALADDGWSLVIDARDGEALGAAAVSLPAGTRVVALPGDITDPAHRAALARAAEDLGGPDLLVNNAGSSSWVSASGASTLTSNASRSSPMG